MLDKQSLWNIARERAIEDYESCGGSWEDADKYEREDMVYCEFEKLLKERREYQ